MVLQEIQETSGRDIKISGFTICKDPINKGHPIIETIISALPLCNEFIILDGCSTDGTIEYIKRLKEIFPKIKIIQEKDPDITGPAFYANRTARGKTFCRGNYILYVQSDEIIHEKTIDTIRLLPNLYPNEIGFMFPMIHLLTLDFYTPYPTPFKTFLLKNIPMVKPVHDASVWNVEGKIISLEYPVYHLIYVFPLNMGEKLIKHYEKFKFKWLLDAYKRATIEGENYMHASEEAIPLTSKEKEQFPKLIKGLYGMKKYTVREELFDIEYLKSIYGESI